MIWPFENEQSVFSVFCACYLLKVPEYHFVHFVTLCVCVCRKSGDAGERRDEARILRSFKCEWQWMWYK